MLEPIKLIVIEGDPEHAGQDIPLRGAEFVIGRAASCDLAVDNGRLSMQHCRLVRQDAQLHLHDLRSTYGTLVNGKEVQTCELKDGDVIRVGPLVVLVAIGERASEARRRAYLAITAKHTESSTGDLHLRGRDPNEDTPVVESARRIFESMATRSTRSESASATEETEKSGIVEPVFTANLSGRHRACLQLRRTEQGIAVVELLDRSIIQDADIFQINRDLDHLIGDGHCRMVLDFGNVHHLSSQALGILLQAQKRCKAAGGVLKVANPNPEVAEIFKIANLRRAVEIYAQEDQALASDWPEAPPLPTSPLKSASIARPVASSSSSSSSSTKASPQLVKLVIEVGKSKGKSITVGTSRFVIGRDPRCQLRPASEAISRVHTRIDQRDGHVYVRDLGTTNGTLLGTRVLRGEEAEAQDGDQLQIGPLVFKLSITTPAASKTNEAEDTAASWLFNAEDIKPGDTAFHPLPSRIADPASPISQKNVGLTDFKRLKTQVVGDSLLVTVLSSELADEEQIGPVRHELIALLDQAVPKRLVIRLDRVTALSSLAVAMLLGHFQRLDRAGGGMRLCNVRDEIFPALESVLDSGVVPIFPSAEQALTDPWPIT